jgi:hypothetical protein
MSDDLVTVHDDEESAPQFGHNALIIGATGSLGAGKPYNPPARLAERVDDLDFSERPSRITPVSGRKRSGQLTLAYA